MSAHSAGFGIYKCGGGSRCITFVPINSPVPGVIALASEFATSGK